MDELDWPDVQAPHEPEGQRDIAQALAELLGVALPTPDAAAPMPPTPVAAAAAPLLDLALDVLDAIAHGVLLVEPDGTLLQANHSARMHLAATQALSLSAGRVRAQPGADATCLRGLLADASSGRAGLAVLGGGTISVAAIPVGSPTATDRHAPAACRSPAEGAQAGAVALVLSRAPTESGWVLSRFARHHELTPAEVQVLSLLCQGFNAPETATRLGVAVSTVRSHVRSLCAKTGSRGARVLVQQVLDLPPVIPVPASGRMH